jgi:predicted acyltransferase
VTYDPEGLLSTLPAIATLLIGILVGEWLAGNYTRQRKVLGRIWTLLLGWLLNLVMTMIVFMTHMDFIRHLL